MTVGAHRDQVAAFLLDPLDDLLGRVAIGQFRLGRNTGGLELRLNLS